MSSQNLNGFSTNNDQGLMRQRLFDDSLMRQGAQASASKPMNAESGFHDFTDTSGLASIFDVNDATPGIFGLGSLDFSWTDEDFLPRGYSSCSSDDVPASPYRNDFDLSSSRYSDAHDMDAFESRHSFGRLSPRLPFHHRQIRERSQTFNYKDLQSLQNVNPLSAFSQAENGFVSDQMESLSALPHLFRHLQQLPTHPRHLQSMPPPGVLLPNFCSERMSGAIPMPFDASGIMLPPGFDAPQNLFGYAPRHLPSSIEKPIIPFRTVKREASTLMGNADVDHILPFEPLGSRISSLRAKRHRAVKDEFISSEDSSEPDEPREKKRPKKKGKKVRKRRRDADASVEDQLPGLLEAPTAETHIFPEAPKRKKRKRKKAQSQIYCAHCKQTFFAKPTNRGEFYVLNHCCSGDRRRQFVLDRKHRKCIMDHPGNCLRLLKLVARSNDEKSKN